MRICEKGIEKLGPGVRKIVGGDGSRDPWSANSRSSFAAERTWLGYPKSYLQDESLFSLGPHRPHQNSDIRILRKLFPYVVG